MFSKIRRILAFILVLISVSVCIWASLPNPHQAVIQSISAFDMQLPSSGQATMAPFVETRKAVLKWASSMRIGEEEEITLIFEPVTNDNASPTQQIGSSSIYNDYNIMAEARFEVAGINVTPADPTRESMPAGQTVKFKWQVSTDKVGEYNGRVWLSLRFLPLDGSQASQVPVYIREVNIQSTSLFGLTETMAYVIGGAGMVLGGAFVFGDMIGLVRRWIRKIATEDAKEL